MLRQPRPVAEHSVNIDAGTGSYRAVDLLKKLWAGRNSLLQIDRAIALWILNRGWGAIATGLTIVLIAKELTKVEQGYYYTFSSLLAIQVLLELGFGYVLCQVIAHEYAVAQDDVNAPESAAIAKARISELIRFSANWYASIACIFIFAVSVIGWCFFSINYRGEINWQWPWFLTVIFFSANILLSPVYSFLEGTQQVSQSITTRTIQDVLGYLTMWVCFWLNLSLYSIVAFHAARAITGISWVYGRGHLRFIHALRVPTIGKGLISWKTELLPFQWRIAVSTMSGYAIFYLFSPALFAYQGAVEAGKIGMTVAIFAGLSTISMAWMNTKVPLFCQLIATQKFVELNSIHKHALLTSLGVSAGLVMLTIIAVQGAQYFHLAVAARVFTGPSLVFLGVASFANQAIFSWAVYVRAFKEEPFLVISINMGVATGIAIIWLAKVSGATAVTGAYALLTIGYALPAGWKIFKAKKALVIQKILSPVQAGA